MSLHVRVRLRNWTKIIHWNLITVSIIVKHILWYFQLINFLFQLVHVILLVLYFNDMYCNADKDLDKPNKITPPWESRYLSSSPVLNETYFYKVQRMITQQIKNIENIVQSLIKYHLNSFRLMGLKTVDYGQNRWDFSSESKYFSS